jgi:virginiamycin B lyase
MEINHPASYRWKLSRGASGSFRTESFMTSPCFLFALVSVLPRVLGDDPEAFLPIEKTAQASIHLEGFPDWLEIGSGSLWVSNPGLGAVQRIDPDTNKVLAEVKVNNPCAAMAAGYGSLWVASRKNKSIYRIDANNNKVIAAIPATVADSEASLAAGEGGVWVLTDRKGVLSRIDPATNEVVAQINVKPYSYAAVSGFGAIWVTNTGSSRSTENGSVQRVDPRTNTVVATITVRGQPRFLAAGDGAVWVLNQKDGTVSKIDPRTNEVVATIDVGVPGPGGDIAAGEGAVWVRATRVLLSVIDPKTNKVIKRFGPANGSGAVRAGDGKVWVSAHDVNRVWRLDLRP